MLNNFKDKKREAANLLFFTNSSPYGFVHQIIFFLKVCFCLDMPVLGMGILYIKNSGLRELQVPSPKVLIPLWSWLKNWS